MICCREDYVIKYQCPEVPAVIAQSELAVPAAMCLQERISCPPATALQARASMLHLCLAAASAACTGPLSSGHLVKNEPTAVLYA